MSNNVKLFCNSSKCSFKPVKFNTFEYMYCTTCKSEVTEDMVEYKARRKAAATINPHLTKDEGESDNEQGDLFDFLTHHI